MSLYENQKVIYSYQNIVEMMISPNPELESCDILLTDTLFIGEDGQLLFWAKTDKGKVSWIANNKLGFQDTIRGKFPKIVNERRKDTKTFLSTFNI